MTVELPATLGWREPERANLLSDQLAPCAMPSSIAVLK